MNIQRSSLKIFGANVASALTVFVGITLFARELTAEQMGIFFLFEAMLGILAIPADFGIRGAVEKRLSEGQDTSGIVGTALLLKIIPLVFISGGILIFSSRVNQYLGADIALYVVIAIWIQEFALLTISLIRGELRVGETAFLQFSRQFVWLFGGGALVLSGFGVRGLVLGTIAGFAVMLAWGTYNTTVSLGRPDVNSARSLFDYSKYNFISSLGGYFYNWMDILIIGIFLTKADVGAYEVAWRVTAIVMLASRAIATTIFPQMSSWEADGLMQRIEQLIPRVITPSLLFVVPAFFGTLLFSREILTFIFGSEYSVAWLVLILLMGDKVFQAIQLIIGRSLQAINRPDLAAKAALISTGVNLVLNVLLIWQFGIIGAAIATVIASLLNDLLHGFYLSRFISLQFPWREIGYCILSSVGMLLIMLVIKSMVAITGLPILVGLITLAAAIYLSFVLLSSTIRAKTIRHVNELRLP